MLKVLIVDDSTVYRGQIRAALTGVDQIEVVGNASNGRLALEFLKSRSVDVMVLDLEMPELNGLEVLAEVKRLNLQMKIIVFSSSGKSGAETAMQALRAGAHDVLLKPTLAADDKNPADAIRRQLLPRILQFLAGSGPVVPSLLPTPGPQAPFNRSKLGSILPRVLVIASSTGGPAALEKLFSLIGPPFACPILIAQHMPPGFTQTLAERLTRISGCDVKEAKHLELIQMNHVYIAPGDFHLRVKNTERGMCAELDGVGERRNSVRPAADYLFESAANLYRNACLGLVLTGMGADGKDGAVAIKDQGGAIMIQDKASSVVFGMPGAVYDAKAFDFMGNLEELAQALIQIGIVSKAAAPGDTKGANRVG